MPELHVGWSRVAFYYRKDMAPVSAGIEDRKTDTGRMKVSSVELTVLDLLRYPRAAGALTISPRSCRISAARSTSLDQVAVVSPLIMSRSPFSSLRPSYRNHSLASQENLCRFRRGMSETTSRVAGRDRAFVCDPAQVRGHHRQPSPRFDLDRNREKVSGTENGFLRQCARYRFLAPYPPLSFSIFQRARPPRMMSQTFSGIRRKSVIQLKCWPAPQNLVQS